VIKSGRERWMGHTACMGDMRNAHNILVGKFGGKIPLQRTGHKLGISEWS
jgi:hypothetical protein